MLILLVISIVLVFGSALFARLRVRPWWIWMIWLGVSIAVLVTLVVCDITWQHALTLVLIDSVIGLLGPEVRRMLEWLLPRLGRVVYRAFRSVLRSCCRSLRRWIRRRPFTHTAYLLVASGILFASVSPHLGLSVAVLGVAMIGLRFMVAGIWPFKKVKAK